RGTSDASRGRGKKNNAIFAVIIALAGSLILACLISPIILRLLWKGTPATRDSPSGNTVVPRPPFSDRSDSEQGMRLVSSAPATNAGWTMGPDGPILTDKFGRIMLNLQQEQIAEVNRVLQEVYGEYPELESQNSERTTSQAGHVVV